MQLSSPLLCSRRRRLRMPTDRFGWDICPMFPSRRESVEFFSVLEELRRIGVRYSAQIAGPVARTAETTFTGLLASYPEVVYCGPLYGEAKDKFYDSLDVLLFPTDYANEAEPLVIHEAIRAGISVIACERGAIADILRNGAGSVVPKAAFKAAAVGRIRAFDADRDELRRAQSASLEQARRMRESAGVRLSALVEEMVGSKWHVADVLIRRAKDPVIVRAGAESRGVPGPSWIPWTIGVAGPVLVAGSGDSLRDVPTVHVRLEKLAAEEIRRHRGMGSRFVPPPESPIPGNSASAITAGSATARSSILWTASRSVATCPFRSAAICVRAATIIPKFEIFAT